MCWQSGRFDPRGAPVSDTDSTQAAVLSVLDPCGAALRTREVCDRINIDRSTPLVLERVYAALVALHRRGVVTRCSGACGRHVFWQLASC